MYEKANSFIFIGNKSVVYGCTVQFNAFDIQWLYCLPSSPGLLPFRMQWRWSLLDGDDGDAVRSVSSFDISMACGRCMYTTFNTNWIHEIYGRSHYILCYIDDRQCSGHLSPPFVSPSLHVHRIMDVPLSVISEMHRECNMYTRMCTCNAFWWSWPEKNVVSWNNNKKRHDYYIIFFLSHLAHNIYYYIFYCFQHKHILYISYHTSIARK